MDNAGKPTSGRQNFQVRQDQLLQSDRSRHEHRLFSQNTRPTPVFHGNVNDTGLEIFDWSRLRQLFASFIVEFGHELYIRLLDELFVATE